MKFAKNSKVVFIGDSITDFDRARPYGEGRDTSIGRSYVGLVDGFIKAAYPDAHIRIINMGISGNTTRDLKDRWQTDVMDLKPDWLSILIGINDVWRHFDRPFIVESQVGIAEYRANLEELIVKTLPTLKGGLILMTPYFMEQDKTDAMRVMMDEYGAVVKELAQKYGAVLIDLQAEFDRYFAHNHPMSVNWDYIHPDIVGHSIIARAILKAIDYEW
ncbi:MAG: SGNH/GDSL hydrolase family protein [Candidatus Merdivicinus sp.]|jgi:lysophospholipase L1-like esterase